MTDQRTPTDVAATARTRQLLAGAAGGAIMAMFGFATQVMRSASDVDPNLWRWPWTAGAFPVAQAVWVTAHALIIVGFLSLTRSRGTLVAVAGSSLLLVAEIASLAVAEATEFPVAVGLMYSLGALLAGIGLVMAGPRTRIAGIWALLAVVLTMTPFGYAVIGIWGLLLLVVFLRER